MCIPWNAFQHVVPNRAHALQRVCTVWHAFVPNFVLERRCNDVPMGTFENTKSHITKLFLKIVIAI